MQFGIFVILSHGKLIKLFWPRYCIPMDGSRPILSSELEFFDKGTGKGKSRSTSLYGIWLFHYGLLFVPTVTKDEHCAQ